MKPRNANTHKKLLNLRSDNVSSKAHWMLLHEDRVTIASQRSGQRATYMVDIPKREFNKLVDWYMRDQKAKKPTARKLKTR